MKLRIIIITTTLVLVLANAAQAGSPDESVFIFRDTMSQPADTLAHSEAPADSVKKKDTIPDYCAICENHVHDIVYAPYYTEFKRQWPFIIGSAAVYATGIIMASVNPLEPLSEAELSRLDKNDVNSFDRPATGYWSPSAGRASDFMLLGITVLPVVFLAEHHTKVDIIPLAVMAAEAYLFNYGVTTICKNITQRIRPYAYNPEVPNSEKTSSDMRESFFSGHTSQTAAATFLFANVINDYHPNMRPGLKTSMWIFAATVPAVEGYLRVRAGKHFPTDVITGYIVGATSGWLIPKMHRYQKLHYKYGIGFVPSREGMMMNFTYRF